MEIKVKIVTQAHFKTAQAIPKSGQSAFEDFLEATAQDSGEMGSLGLKELEDLLKEAQKDGSPEDYVIALRQIVGIARDNLADEIFFT